MKKLINFLFQWDGLWSVPFLILQFILFGAYVGDFFGEGVATYDPGILQALILAAVFMVAINFITWLGIKFNFPAVYTYLSEEFSKDFKEITRWQRISISLGIYLFLVAAFLFLIHLLL